MMSLPETTNKKRKVPEGYKQTAVGIIPEEWEVQSLDSIGDFLKGKGISKNEIVENGLSCLTYGELYTRHHDVIREFASFISEKSAKNSVQLERGDILFAGSGETLEEIGKCAAFVDHFKAYAGGDIVILRQKSQDPHFLGYLLNHGFVNRQKHKLGQGHSVVHIYSSSLKKIAIPLPPLREQEKIAAILSTWDEAIEKTQKLIDQLKQRNKGLAQQLLTGKKRLKGFKGEWKVVELGSLGDSYNGLIGKSKEDFGKGRRFVTYLSIFNNPIITSTQAFGYVQIDEQETQNEVRYGDIFFTVSSETPEEVGMSSVLLIDTEHCYLNSFCFGFRLYDFKTLDPLFAAFLLRSEGIRKEIVKLAQGSTRFNLNKSGIEKLHLHLPTTAEQKAISNVMIAAVTEVKQCEQKIAVLQQQKKGLMQKLLMGEVRAKTKTP